MKLGIAGPIFVSAFPDCLCSGDGGVSPTPSGVTAMPIIHPVPSFALCEIPWPELRERPVPSAFGDADPDAGVT